MDSTPAGSQSQHVIVKRRELVDVIRSSQSSKFEQQCEDLRKHVQQITGYSELPSEAKKVLAYFTSQFKVKWESASRKYEYFTRKNEEWLEKCLSLPAKTSMIRSISGGRRSIDFGESSERSKRRKTEVVRADKSAEELSFAAQMSLRASGKLEAAEIVKDITFTTPTRASKYREAYRKRLEPNITLSKDKALSMMVEAKLTKRQYNIIRATGMECNSNIFPNHEAVLEAKKRCYPDEISVTETSAEVNLQSLMNHTAECIVLVQKDIFHTLATDHLRNLKLVSKWGCDGSSGHSEYKQKFMDETASDATMFVTSIVPLQLVCEVGDKKTFVWQNPRPSSPRFCRPVRLQFIQETTKSTIEEVKYVENQINCLKPSRVIFDECEVIVKHELLLTMIDGKVCNAITATSSTQRCFLCGATSKDFNNIYVILQRKIDESNLRFGLSTLHAWIRMFECLLHLSYRLPVKKWQIRPKDDKEKVAENKKKIQEQFRLKLGLLVDRPKPGYGSTNDGNTARRFFEDPVLSSSITGVDEEIIRRFHVILQAISSGYTINLGAFETFAIETAKKFADRYTWFYMPSSVHKLLIHGPKVISTAILPIGQLSEEAQEARHKDIKKFREGFSRKFSRKATREDIFHQLLVSSDPCISSLRKVQKLSKEVLQLLSEPETAYVRENEEKLS